MYKTKKPARTTISDTFSWSIWQKDNNHCFTTPPLLPPPPSMLCQLFLSDHIKGRDEVMSVPTKVSEFLACVRERTLHLITRTGWAENKPGWSVYATETRQRFETLSRNNPKFYRCDAQLLTTGFTTEHEIRIIFHFRRQGYMCII